MHINEPSTNWRQLSTFCLRLALMMPLTLQAMYFCNNPQHRRDYKIFNKHYVYHGDKCRVQYLFTAIIEQNTQEHREAYIQYLKGHKDDALLTVEQLKTLERADE